MFALLLWAGVQTVSAQTKAKGKIIDKSGEAIPGAAVKVNGTTTGTMTDADGNFELDVPDGGKITISALGYGPQTLDANGNMTITMTQGENILTDVVVSQPYGPPVTKGKYVGAADVITAKQIENRPVTDLTQAIEGASPGIQTSSASGQPGSGAGILIRGIGSLTGGVGPLYVVDGNVYTGDITSINPSDIENITVLKDATSTSLYGSRGSNGVIVVTTKRGKRGEKPRISVDGKIGTVTRGLPNYKVMRDPKDYYEASWRGMYNSLVTGGQTPAAAGQAASGLSAEGVVDLLGYNSYNIPGVDAALQNASLLDPTTGKLNPNAQLKYATDDWSKEMQRTGLRQDYNFNVSGGSDKTDYFLSAGYLKEKGYLLATDYDRFTTRANVNSQATDWLKVGMNLSASMTTQNGNLSQSGTSSVNPNYIALNTAPVFPVYYRDSLNNKVIDPQTGKDKYDYGSTVKDPNSSMGTRAVNPGQNVIGEMQLNENRSDIKNVVFSPYLEVKLPKDFSFRTNLTTNYTNVAGTTWYTTLHGTYKPTPDQDPNSGGLLDKNSANYFSYTWNQTLSWKKTLGKDHELSASVVHENYYYNTSYQDASVKGFAFENLRELSNGSATPTVASQTDNERMESYLGLVSYAYKGKYLFDANIRRDGLSRFYQDNRWGTFGAVGAAWIISSEDFMKNVSWIQNLKLKASYGTQGNNDIRTATGGVNYYAWQGLYDVSRPNGSNAAVVPITLPNYNLQWESQKNLNIGTEFTMFNNILSAEINVYNRSTSGLYFNVPNAPSTGFPTKLQNAASLYNRGIELNFYVTPVNTKDFTWRINANFTKFKNVITSLGQGQDSVVGVGNGMWKKGHSIYDYWMVHSDGVDSKNGDELYSYIAADGSTRDTSDYIAAQNNGGRHYTGTSSIPKLQGAITNSLRYKSFTFSFLITYSIGGQFYDGIYQSLTTMETVGANNLTPDIKDAWTETNTSAKLPRFEVGNQDIGQRSDRFLIDASWLNIRNINLSYDFPAGMLSKAGMGSLTAYVSADNVAFFSHRQGMNPQQSFGGSADYLYTPSRVLTFGLRLGL